MKRKEREVKIKELSTLLHFPDIENSQNSHVVSMNTEQTLIFNRVKNKRSTTIREESLDQNKKKMVLRKSSKKNFILRL